MRRARWPITDDGARLSAYRPGEHPADLPPPVTESGVIGWLRRNLFSSIGNAVLTFWR